MIYQCYQQTQVEAMLDLHVQLWSIDFNSTCQLYSELTIAQKFLYETSNLAENGSNTENFVSDQL